jgi:hypothetical protein
VYSCNEKKNQSKFQHVGSDHSLVSLTPLIIIVIIHDENTEDDGSNFEESMSENETKMQNSESTRNFEERGFCQHGVYPSLAFKLQSDEERALMISMISTCWKRYSSLQLM